MTNVINLISVLAKIFAIFWKLSLTKFYDDSRILNIVISFLILLILTNFHKYHLHQFYIFLLNIL